MSGGKLRPNPLTNGVVFDAIKLVDAKTQCLQYGPSDEVHQSDERGGHVQNRDAHARFCRMRPVQLSESYQRAGRFGAAPEAVCIGVRDVATDSTECSKPASSLLSGGLRNRRVFADRKGATALWTTIAGNRAAVISALHASGEPGGVHRAANSAAQGAANRHESDRRASEKPNQHRERGDRRSPPLEQPHDNDQRGQRTRNDEDDGD